MTPDYRAALKQLTDAVAQLPATRYRDDVDVAYHLAHVLIYGPCPTCGTEGERLEDGTAPICATCICRVCGAPARTHYIDDGPLCGDRVCAKTQPGAQPNLFAAHGEDGE